MQPKRERCYSPLEKLHGFEQNLAKLKDKTLENVSEVKLLGITREKSHPEKAHKQYDEELLRNTQRSTQN